MQAGSLSKSAKHRQLVSRVAMPTIIIVICVIAFWLTTEFDRVPPILKRGIQPSDFPQLLIALIVILCVFEIFTDKSEAPEKLSLITWQTIALLLGFILLAELDMFIGLGVFSVAIAALWGERRKRALAALGIVMPLAVFFLFDLVFEIRFPRGLLTSIWYG